MEEGAKKDEEDLNMRRYLEEKEMGGEMPE